MPDFATLTRTQKLELLGAGVLILGVICVTLYYMATHKAPEPYALTPTVATSTPPLAEPQTVEEHAQYYDIEAVYPSETPLLASAGAKADAGAIASMKRFVDTTIADFKRDGGFETLTKEDIDIMGYEDGRKQALFIDHEETRGADTVSYSYSIYVDSFGAHPNAFYRTFTFDLATGKELTLLDLFQPKAKYLARLMEISRYELAKELGPDADLDYLNAGTVPETASFQNFTIDGQNMVIIFPPYQVGPYALGTKTVTIPLESLRDILKPAYLP